MDGMDGMGLLRAPMVLVKKEKRTIDITRDSIKVFTQDRQAGRRKIG